MRLLPACLALLATHTALACDFGGPTDALTLLETAKYVVVARARTPTEFRITESLAGDATGVHAFAASDCAPRLVPGRPYLVFLATTGRAAFGAGANDSAVELPDDGLGIRSLVATLQKWRAATTEAEKRRVLPEIAATRLPAFVEAALRRR